MTTTEEVINAYMSDLKENGFVNETRNGSHTTSFEKAKDMAELVRVLKEAGLVTTSEKRVIGNRIR